MFIVIWRSKGKARDLYTSTYDTEKEALDIIDKLIGDKNFRYSYHCAEIHELVIGKLVRSVDCVLDEELRAFCGLVGN